jgi:hypothetical protein
VLRRLLFGGNATDALDFPEPSPTSSSAPQNDANIATSSTTSNSSAAVSTPAREDEKAPDITENPPNATVAEADNNIIKASVDSIQSSQECPASVPPTTSKRGLKRKSYIDSPNRSFISFPFVLSPAAKSSILELDANVQMREGSECVL